MLDHRLRRWTNIETALGERLAFSAETDELEYTDS